ncbi:MAG: hypothetical protein WDO73_25740 [Ignavibacteriota bacterium]
MRVPLTLLLLSGALAAQVINPVEQTGAIHGTILDSAGHPLLGVAVDAYRGAQPEIVRLGNGTTRPGSRQNLFRPIQCER